MELVRIAVDGMGGDHGPSVVVPATLQALRENQDIHITLVGNQALLAAELAKCSSYDDTRINLKHAAEYVGMDELPTQALRYKKDSSMRVAIDLVKEGVAQACVSAGNTGALMAIAHFLLKNIPGVYRPAIVSMLPTSNGHFRMLDLGANVDSSASNLAQFAVMGSILATAVDNIKQPRVYLLNIGVELIKGNKQVKETAQLLATMKSLNYQGYIEGDDIYQGKADVVVCDGFVGNVALKTSEGAAKFMIDLIKNSFKRNLLTKAAGFIALPVLKSLTKKLNPAIYNGATLVGLQGVVIKSHGHADAYSFARAIHTAKVQVQKNVLHLISNEITHTLQSGILGND